MVIKVAVNFVGVRNMFRNRYANISQFLFVMLKVHTHARSHTHTHIKFFYFPGLVNWSVKEINV